MLYLRARYPAQYSPHAFSGGVRLTARVRLEKLEAVTHLSERCGEEVP